MSEHLPEPPEGEAEWQAPNEPVEALAPPNIEEQKTSLAAVQLDHLDKLKASGLAEKAAKLLGIEPDTAQILTAKARASEDGEVVFRLATSRYKVAESGQESRDFRYLDVARSLGDSILPATDEFGFDEAESVADMVLELDSLRDQGVLPNLDATNMSIFDPSTALKRDHSK